MNDYERKLRLELLATRTTMQEKAVCRVLTHMNIRYVQQFPIRSKSGKLSFLDIYLPYYKIAIEVDGGYHFTHNQQAKDNARSSRLRRKVGDIHIYRINNRETGNVVKLHQRLRQIIKTCEVFGFARNIK